MTTKSVDEKQRANQIIIGGCLKYLQKKLQEKKKYMKQNT